jgi:hypothetical protein
VAGSQPPSGTHTTFNETAGTFKPYNLQEYKQIKEQASRQKMGGLGANIGSEQWAQAQRKKE